MEIFAHSLTGATGKHIASLREHKGELQIAKKTRGIASVLHSEARLNALRTRTQKGFNDLAERAESLDSFLEKYRKLDYKTQKDISSFFKNVDELVKSANEVRKNLMQLRRASGSALMVNFKTSTSDSIELNINQAISVLDMQTFDKLPDLQKAYYSLDIVPAYNYLLRELHENSQLNDEARQLLDDSKRLFEGFMLELGFHAVITVEMRLNSGAKSMKHFNRNYERLVALALKFNVPVLKLKAAQAFDLNQKASLANFIEIINQAAEKYGKDNKPVSSV